MIKFFNVDKQYQQDRDSYLDLADQVYSSGQVIDGPFCRKLENSLKSRTGRKHCVLTASCTDALAFVGQTLKSSNNTFIFPEISFPATNNGFIRTALADQSNFVYVSTDCNGNIDINALNDHINASDPDSNIIVVWVNLFGHPVDFDAIVNLQLQYPHVTFVEDAAQSIGAKWRNTPSGAVGIASCFSFDPTKNLSAFGIGGAMLTDDAAIASAVDDLRRPHTARWINHGYNSQINEVDAAMVWWKLENKFDSWQARRTNIANYYIDKLDDVVSIVKPLADSISAWHKFVIKHPRRNNIQSLLLESGIETKIHYNKTLNNTENNFTQCCLSLPIYPELTDNEVEFIASSTAHVIKLLS